MKGFRKTLLALPQTPRRAQTPGPFKHEVGDEQGLDRKHSERAHNVLLVLLPEGQFFEANDFAGRQGVLADAPTPKLAPIEHGHSRGVLDRDVLRTLAVRNPIGDFRRSGPDSFWGGYITANESHTDISSGHPVNRDRN